MPEFHERAEAREREKRERLAPHLERALARKQWMPALADDEIPEVVALGRQIVQQLPKEQRTARLGHVGGLAVPLEDPAEE